MRSFVSQSAPFWFALVAASLAPAAARADDDVGETSSLPEPQAVDEARVHFDRGLELFVERAYDASLVELERAMQLAPTYKLFYNIGLIHKVRNDFAASLDAFQRYLVGGGDSIADARRAEVEQKIASLSVRVARIQVATPASGAIIEIDDVVVGTTPLPAPVVVNPGRRKVTATVAGAIPATNVVTVVSGEAVKIVLSPIAIAAPVQAQAHLPAPVVEPPARRAWTLPIVAWSATGVLAAGAVVAGVSSLSAASTLKQMRDTPAVSAGDIAAQERSVRTLSTVTDVLLVGVLAGGAASTYLTIRAASAPPLGRKPGGADVKVGFGPASVSLSGSF
jgi:hypothetical protein